MQTACDWLLETLANPTSTPPRCIHERHLSRDNAFDLADTISFLPQASLPQLTTNLQSACSESLKLFAAAEDPVNSDELQDIVSVVRVLWALVSKLPDALPSLQSILSDLHEALPTIPCIPTQDLIAKTCELYYLANHALRDRLLPNVLLYLLQSALSRPSTAVSPAQRTRLKPASFVRRLFTVRKALNNLHFSASAPYPQLHELFICTVSSPSFFRSPDGRKFLAHLLSLPPLQNTVFDAILQQFTTIRPSVAPLYATVLLHSWKTFRDDFLQARYMHLADLFLCASSQPLSSNLQATLSLFHSNKRISGIDLLLHRSYTPILYRHLHVANPLVRKNALLLLADAFPVHDPGVGCDVVEQAVEMQSTKMLSLLQDPAAIVRKTAIESVCRVLGLYWDIVPITTARNMLHVIVTKLAFDTSSIHVRIAVFEGIRFLLDNVHCHAILSVSLPKLELLIHDKCEKVRLAILDMLLSLKKKRIRSLRYFDVVSVDHLLSRLPVETPSVSAKIMKLIVSSFFPVEKKGKSEEEIASSQTRACLSLVANHPKVVSVFYSSINLYVPPGPLCEFAMRISGIALKEKDKTRGGGARERSKRSTKVSRRGGTRARGAEDNTQANDANEESTDGVQYSTLLSVVADVLVSVSASLQKEANAELREYVDNIFGGAAMKPLLIERGNPAAARAAAWRIASCISPKKVAPLKVTWREQLDSIVDNLEAVSDDRLDQQNFLASLILCGIRWDLISTLAAVLSGWSDGILSGVHTSSLRNKAQKKRGRSNRKGGRAVQESPRSSQDADARRTRSKFLNALCVCAEVIMENEEVRNEFTCAVSRASSDEAVSYPHILRVTNAIRNGSLGAVEFAVDERGQRDTQSNTSPKPYLLLRGVALTCKLATMLSACMFNDKVDLFDFRELVTWSSQPEIWKRAHLLGSEFASCLSTLCLSAFADSISLQVLVDEDIRNIVTATQCVLSELLSAEQQISWRSAGELLRIAFQLRDQISTLDPDELSESRCSAETLKFSSSSVLRRAATSLGETDEEEMEDYVFSSVAGLLFGYLKEILVKMSGEEDLREFNDTFSNVLVESFSVYQRCVKSYFPNLVVRVITWLCISQQHKSTEQPWKLIQAVVHAMKQDGTDGSVCVANFFVLLTSHVQQRLSNDNDSNVKKVGFAAVELFARMESFFRREFPELENPDSQLEPAENLDVDRAREALQGIQTLRNANERDFGSTGCGEGVALLHESSQEMIATS